MDGQPNSNTLEADEEDTTDVDSSALTSQDIEYHLRARLKKKGCDIRSDDERISRRRLKDILEDFGVPNSTDVHYKLSEMPTFREVVNYISGSYEREEDEPAAEQNEYLQRHTADEQQKAACTTA